MRTNKDYEELAKPIDLVVHTKVPTKWILIDRETVNAPSRFTSAIDPKKVNEVHTIPKKSNHKKSSVRIVNNS